MKEPAGVHQSSTLFGRCIGWMCCHQQPSRVKDTILPMYIHTYIIFAAGISVVKVHSSY